MQAPRRPSPSLSASPSSTGRPASRTAPPALNGSAEETAFFATFTPELFALLSPLGGGAASIASIATGAGQVLEVAPRNLVVYEGLDQATYEAARDASLALLGGRDGVVEEYKEWVWNRRPERGGGHDRLREL